MARFAQLGRAITKAKAAGREMTKADFQAEIDADDPGKQAAKKKAAAAKKRSRRGGRD